VKEKNLAILLQVFSTGIGLAGYYALIAVGFALIFGTLRIFHVAHGTVFMIAGYTFFSLHRLLGVNIFASAVFSVGCAVLAGLAVDKIVYGPVLRRGGGMFAVFIASLGAALIVEAGFLAWSKGVVSVARTDMLDTFILGGVAFRVFDFVIFGFVATAFSALYLWLHRTSTGLEVRGLTDNADLAAVVGVDVRRTRNAIFLVASALAGLAGVLVAYDTGLEPSIGFKMLFIGVVTVILGGVRNVLLGTAVGATCLGLLTAFAGFLFPEWNTFTIFLIMIGLIIIRPLGILG
jgi:branched-chain amino acid transport system permease protein